jgi:hypothetical protein
MDGFLRHYEWLIVVEFFAVSMDVNSEGSRDAWRFASAYVAEQWEKLTKMQKQFEVCVILLGKIAERLFYQRE